jgi:hypothetical protein
MTDSRKQLRLIIAVAAGAVCFYAAVRFFTEDEPARIRRVIYAAVLGVEKKDRARYGAAISLKYEDDKGFNKWALLKIVDDALLDFDPVKCEIKQLTIDMKQGVEADATIGFKFYFKSAVDQKLYYEAGRVLTHFFKEGRSWKIRKLDYIYAREIYPIQSVS